ncbi:MAG: 3-keto-5-aminohexanoate cleavage protein [Thermodesulfobacteriota bacterium]|nr:3-keto-5-aminohexanoate cleavage protein [Thermodesulfobacteriota bacterium]
MNNPLIITCAVVGAELEKADFPSLPTTPKEIARAATDAVKAGARIVHLHVRDEEGRPTQRTDIFEEVTERIRRRTECIIQYSTGGAVGTPLEERCAPLKLKPHMATLSMGSMNFGAEIFENSEETIRTISDAIQENNILPELEIFDLGMMDTVERYLEKGFIPEKFHVDFVLGVPGGMGGELRNLVLLVDRLREGRTWTVAGVGKFQLPLSVHGIAMGGHVRIGFEDNIYYQKGVHARSNAQLVKRVVRIAQELSRPIATLEQAKEILGL